MQRRSVFVGLFLAFTFASLSPSARADDLSDTSWSVLVSEDCQLSQIGKIALQAGGKAQASAVVETASGSTNSAADTQSTDLDGTWTFADAKLHLSFNDGSLTLDGPVKDGRFLAKAVMKTDLGDTLEQDCVLKRN
jgi:hypothetical protein